MVKRIVLLCIFLAVFCWFVYFALCGPRFITCNRELEFYATVFGGAATLIAVFLSICYDQRKTKYIQEKKAIEDEYSAVVEALCLIRFDIYADVYRRLFSLYASAPYNLIDIYEYTRIVNNEVHKFRLAVNKIQAYSNFIDYEIETEYGVTKVRNVVFLISNDVWAYSKYLKEGLDAIQNTSHVYYNKRNYPADKTINEEYLKISEKNFEKFNNASQRLYVLVPKRGYLDVVLKKLEDYALEYKNKKIEKLDQWI